MGKQECRRGSVKNYDAVDTGLFLASLYVSDAHDLIKNALERIDQDKPGMQYPYEKWAEVQVLCAHLTDVLTDLEELTNFSKKNFYKE